MTTTREYIEQADGTLWLCSKTNDPYGRDTAGREYWVFYCNGPRTLKQSHLVGFYASSIEEARDKLN